MKGLSNWQLMRVRDALRTYHRYEEDHEGVPYTWRDVREAIAVHTGVEIGTDLKNGAERLRQFVEGVGGRGQTGSRKYPVPKPEALEAIVAFLTHKEIRLLSSEELTEPKPSFHAALRMREYFDEVCGDPVPIKLAELNGTYRTVDWSGDTWTLRTLFLNCAEKDGVLEVIEERKRYIMEAAGPAPTPAPEPEPELDKADPSWKCLSAVAYRGWGIVTPEDTMMLFLKHMGRGTNHIYLCLNDVGLLPKQPRADRHLNLLHQDFGRPLSRTMDAAIMATFLTDDMFVFKTSSYP